MKIIVKSGFCGLLSWLFSALWLIAAQAALAQQAVPALSARVVDTAQILSAAEAASIEAQLARVEQTRGSQIAVLLVNTTAPGISPVMPTASPTLGKLGGAIWATVY